MICGIAATIVTMMSGNAPISAVKSLTPASIISGIATKTASITLSIICGIAATIASIMVGNAATKAVKSCIPVSMICGIASSRKSITA